MAIEVIKATLEILIGLIIAVGILSPIDGVNQFLKKHPKFTALLAGCFFVFTAILAYMQFQDVPELTLTPLPHHTGYMLPTADLSSPDARFLNESQKIELYILPKFGEPPSKELIAKFGVIRVHCIHGEAIGCRVQARVNLVEQLGKQQNAYWLDSGFSNWFSMAKKMEVIRDFNMDKKGFGFETFLVNTVEDIHYTEEKDLLLFYMIKGIDRIFLCTDTNEPIAFVDNRPAKFEVELSITAQKYPKTVFKYLVTAKWDDYQIQQL